VICRIGVANLHILILPSWYATPQNPIRGSFFRDQAQALARCGHKVGMLVPPSRFRTFNGLREFLAHWHHSNQDISITHDNQVVVYRMPWWGWLPSVMPNLRGELVLKLFDKYVAENGMPDVLHGHSILYGGYLAAYIGQARKIASVVTEHSSLFLTNGYPFGHRTFIKYTLSHIDKVLAVGVSLADALKSYQPDLNVELVGNVVDTSRFVPPVQQPPASPFVVSIFGRLDKNKAQHLLIEAFALAMKGKSALLYIVGDGSQKAKYERLCDELGITAQTRFFGQLSREEVIPIMQQSHVVVSCSKIETFGVSLIEAMACGKPVIATQSGGPQAVVDESNGLLVPTGDSHALAHALQVMSESHQQYDAHAIREKCVSLFSEQAITKQLEALYDSIQPRY
jgi:L-malate glycosyltransferase